MGKKPGDCNVTIIGAGPYGLAVSAFLKSANVEFRTFGEPMSFWEQQMPAGMCLRSNWGASHIADPGGKWTLDEYCRKNGNHMSRPIPLERFVAYGQWFQREAVPEVERRSVRAVELSPNGFKISLVDGEQFTSKRVVVAAGIANFKSRPEQFNGIPAELASHSTEHRDLGKFKGQSVLVVGAGQSALESAALLKEAGSAVEVVARQPALRWVGLHPGLHKLGMISQMLYSKRDVGPAGISRLVAMPHLFRRLPRAVQDRMAYRAIRPAGSGWLQKRLSGIPITLGHSIRSATAAGSRVRVVLDNGAERTVDHVLMATGFRVDVTRYPFFDPALLAGIDTVNGYPVLRSRLESSVPGLHFAGKPAARSFGPLLGFVSGAEFASTELLRGILSSNRS